MESLVDRRCAGCKQTCDDTMYYACAQNDYRFYTSEPKNDKEILWGEKCKTCKYKFCKIDKAEKCIENDYKYYKVDSVIIEKIELARNNPKYKAFGFIGDPLDIVEELNKFFVENSQVEVVNITKLDGFKGYCPGVMIVVREN